MTNIGHFRAAGKVLEGKSDIPTRLWIAPPTKMDAMILNEEGYYAILGKSGARMEMPGCSLCMGNQAQIRKGSTAMSTSTRNFPNRLGIDTRVYLGSAELAAVCALMGKIPTVAEYLEQVKAVNAKAGRRLSLHELRPDRQGVQSPVRGPRSRFPPGSCSRRSLYSPQDNSGAPLETLPGAANGKRDGRRLHRGCVAGSFCPGHTR
jgi:aconitase A